MPSSPRWANVGTANLGASAPGPSPEGEAWDHRDEPSNRGAAGQRILRCGKREASAGNGEAFDGTVPTAVGPEPATDVDAHRAGADDEMPRDRAPCLAWTVLQHSMTHPGDVLDQHLYAGVNQICRAEQWRVFTSAWPFTIIFKLQWARALSFILGLYVLLRAPEGLARFAWVSDIPAATVTKTKFLRFTALELRNGQTNWSAPVRPDFGLLRAGCKLNHTGGSRADTVASIISFNAEVQYDGWYFTTGSTDAALDPVAFEVHSSIDGSLWLPVADAWSELTCKCWHSLDDEHGKMKAHHDRKAIKQEWPLERYREVMHTFTDVTCLWPYYATVAGHMVHGLSLLLAPAAAIWWAPGAPTRIIAGSSILAGLIKTIALSFIVARGQPLPFASVDYTTSSLALENFLEVFVFPGPIFLSEVYIFERALAWGIIQTTVVFALRRFTALGPVHIIVAGLILIFRERKRREVKEAVRHDMSLFGVAWNAIQEEDGAAEATARLVNFEMEMQKKLGSRYLKLGPRHATDHVGPGPWKGSDLSLSRSLRNVLDSTLWPVSGTDLEAGNRAAAEGRGDMRGKLLIERRSPFLSRLLQTPEPLTSLDQLYAQATMLDPIFRTRVQRLAGMCRGHFYVSSHTVGGPPELRAWSEIQEEPAARCRVRWPAIKHVNQTLRKGILYNGNILRLVDLVRQRIIFTRLSDICECLDTIDSDPDLQILRVKNRFDPSIDAHWTAGYRDVVLVLRVVTPVTTMLGISSHCCELQLAHHDMTKLITPSQHSRYLQYRSVMAFGQSTWHVDDGFFCRAGYVLQSSPSRSLVQIVPAEQNKVHGRAMTEADPSVPSPIVGALRGELVNTHIDDLAAEPVGPDLHALLTERVFEVLRARCHVRGNKLESMLQELQQAVTLADASMVLFARPLAALFKPVIQVVVFLFSMCCLYWYYSYGDNWFHAYVVSRHARFTVHQVRSGGVGQAALAPETGISKLSLLRDGCSLMPVGALSEVEGSSLIVTLPQPTKFNGWAMTASLLAGSEASDPVRFDFSFAEIDTAKHTFEECLSASAWRTQAEVEGQGPAERRAAVVEELVAQHGAWCMAGNLKRCGDLSDAELLRLCIPAGSIRKEEWRMVSASACRWASSSIACIPRPAELFAYPTLARGATHAFDLRPPWYVMTGVVIIYLPIMVSALLCVLMGCMGNLIWTRVSFSLTFLIPGIMELITAGGLAFAARVNHSAPHLANYINPRDSFYWWPLSLSTIVVGTTILLSEKSVVTTFPIYFGINFTALLIHNRVMIGELPFEFPFSSGFLLFFWVVFKLLRFYILRESYKSIEPDSECYDAEWKLVMQSADNAAAIRDLNDVAERLSTSKERPQQALPPSLPTLARGATPAQLCGPEFLPAQLQSSPSRLLFVKPRLRPTLDTLYMQACVLEPIFNLKVQQLATTCHGMFVVRDAAHPDGSCMVPALEWEPIGGLKSVDRSIEKLTRSYEGHVPWLLDIVRQCVVFDNLQDMLLMCRILEDDAEVHVVRVKNRLAETYNARISGGYRDILVNLRVESDLVRRLGLDLHVCELQLILKQFMTHKTLQGHKRYVEFRNKRCE